MKRNVRERGELKRVNINIRRELDEAHLVQIVRNREGEIADQKERVGGRVRGETK